MTIATTLSTLAAQVIAAMSGQSMTDSYYAVAYVDDFSVDSSTLKAKHRDQMDRWIAGDVTAGIPFRPGASNCRIALIAGMASRTGPEVNNVQLGTARAEKVYEYLLDGLGSSQVVDNVQSVGSSQPRAGFTEEGSEHSENRAVGVVFEYEIERVGVVTTVPPTPDPPPAAPLSTQWAISVQGAGSVSDLLPVVDVFGAQAVTGRLRNNRTSEDRQYWLIVGGFQVGLSALPAELAFNGLMNNFVDFATQEYVDFDDFDGTGVVLLGAAASLVTQASSTSFLFPTMGTHVEPDTILITSNIATSLDGQAGLFFVLDP